MFAGRSSGISVSFRWLQSATSCLTAHLLVEDVHSIQKGNSPKKQAMWHSRLWLMILPYKINIEEQWTTLKTHVSTCIGICLIKYITKCNFAWLFNYNSYDIQVCIMQVVHRMEIIQTAQKVQNGTYKLPLRASSPPQWQWSKVISWQFLFLILMVTFTNLSNMLVLLFLCLLTLSIFFPL